MANNYYYIVAGLPDLLLDSAKKPAHSADIIQEIQDQLSAGDRQVFSTMRLPYDNLNLIHLLRKTGNPFDARGTFELQALEEELKCPERVPEYMRLFLEERKEEKPLHPECILEDQLQWHFYEQVCSHPNSFIRDYYSFERDLRNILAAINHRKLTVADAALASSLVLSHAIIGRNDLAQQLLKSNAPDFGLAAQWRWTEAIFSLEPDETVDFEKAIDQLRWENLDELTVSSGFQVETICAFLIKLTLVERWHSLDPKEGEHLRDKLLAELNSHAEIHE